MAFVKPDAASFARIKVIGIGGGGCNAVLSMLDQNQIRGVDFIAINTDAQALLSNKCPIKMQIGEDVTRGLGAGGNPQIGEQAAEESAEKIKDLMADTDMVFLTCGLGGGTGTGAIPVIAQIAKDSGALTVAVVTKPFTFEGTRRMVVAEEGLEKLRDKVDSLIVIPNQRIMEVVDQKMTLLEAFKIVDNILTQGVQGISDIITLPGLINVDFADVKAIMSNAGTSLLGIGTGIGENRAQTAARAAISSPLLDISIQGARGILFNITGGPDLTMNEVDEAAKMIAQMADADANIIFGASVNDKMVDQLRIIVIATGFDNARKYTSFTPKAAPVTPSIQGIIGEKPAIVDTPVPLANDNAEFEPKEEDFGEQYDIPAFLRQGKNI